MSQYPYPTPYPPYTLGAGQTGGAGAQATYTPINPNVTIATLCTPLCGAGAQGGAASAQSVSLIFCGAPSVAGGASPAQATYTPINCNVTIATLCTPLCGAAAQGGGASAQPVSPILCGAPSMPGAGASAPQATYTPINCNVTVATLCTPLCGAAAQGGGASAQSVSLIFCGAPAPQATYTPINCNVTIATLCTPVCGAAQGGSASAQSVSLIFCGAPAPQATYTPINCNVTVATLCTPLCGAAAQGGAASAQSISLIFCGAPSAPGGGAPAPQATYTPINCNVTIATLCTPLCGAAAQGVSPGGTQGPYTPAWNQSTTIAAPPQGGSNGGAAAQSTFTPVNCQVTVFSLCTPIC